MPPRRPRRATADNVEKTRRYSDGVATVSIDEGASRGSAAVPRNVPLTTESASSQTFARVESPTAYTRGCRLASRLRTCTCSGFSSGYGDSTAGLEFECRTSHAAILSLIIPFCDHSECVPLLPFLHNPGQDVAGANLARQHPQSTQRPTSMSQHCAADWAVVLAHVGPVVPTEYH